MSETTPTAPSLLDAMIKESLDEYEKEAEESLLPLIQDLKGKSIANILADFDKQAKDFKKSATDDKLIESLNPIVNVLCVSSDVIGAGVGLVFPPASVIFAGVDVHLSIFEHVGNFCKRLAEHTERATMEAIKDIIVKTMIEVLKIFAFMTKEIKRGKAKRVVKSFFTNLFGSDVIKGALSKLNSLTQEEGNRLIAHTSNTADRMEVSVVAGREENKLASDKLQQSIEGVSVSLEQFIKDRKEWEAHEEKEKRSWLFSPASLGRD
ncbi:hypothetical protein EI94DRAFT_1791533 [Lactarius quietus]|nr:hypothetical protein EI94DRAFT_1791533 [Lactarius quietus]